MLLFIPGSLCALKRVAAKAEHAKFGAAQGIRIVLTAGLYRAEATDGHRAIIVQGMAPAEQPLWPGFKDLPDDAFETIILPKDMERACKVGEGFLQNRFGLVGLATQGSAVSLGLGTDVVGAPTVDGRFPKMDQVIPKKRPLFSFRVDPKTLAETLLAMAELLSDEAREVQCLYYGDGLPIGFCAKNAETGMMIDALVVPLVAPKPDAKDKPTNNKSPGAEPTNGKQKEPATAPEANGQAKSSATTPAPEAPNQDAKPDATGRSAKKAKSRA